MRALVSKSKIFAFNEERYKLCMKDELHKVRKSIDIEIDKILEFL